MVQAGKGDLRTLANGLFPAGLDAASLTDEGRAEVRAAVDVILKLWDNRNTRLVLALEQLDKAANEIERLIAAAADMRRQLLEVGAALDEADALIMELAGVPFPVSYPEGCTRATAMQNWKARCVERGQKE